MYLQKNSCCCDYCLSALTQPIYSIDRSLTKGDNTFDFRGQSGQIAISDSKKGSVSIKWKKIEEYSPSQTKVNYVNNFASQTFSWSNPVAMIVNGQNCSSVTLQSFLHARYNSSVTIPFNITTYLFETDATVFYGNITLTVPKNSIKFTINMNNWPFASPNNTLRFGATIEVKNKIGQNRTVSTKKN